MIYKCTITSGGGTEYDGGDFEIVETPKTLVFNNDTSNPTKLI